MILNFTGVTTWHDPRVPKDLLVLINPEGKSLEDVIGPFPSGWEMRSTRSNRNYYVDHAHRTTQFTDPRLAGDNLTALLTKYREVKARQTMAPAAAAAQPQPEVSLRTSTNGEAESSTEDESRAGSSESQQPSQNGKQSLSSTNAALS